MRPSTIVEIESGNSVVVMESGVNDQCTGLWIEFQEKEAILKKAFHRQTTSTGVVTCPVLVYGRAEYDTDDFDRASAIMDVDHYDSVQSRNALDQIVRNGVSPAHAKRKCPGAAPDAQSVAASRRVILAAKHLSITIPIPAPTHHVRTLA